MGATFSTVMPFDTVANVPTCPFIFTGQRFDAETGLYYYKRRYYLPVLGRFLSKDPIGLFGHVSNPYGYVNDNPVNRSRPQTGPTSTWSTSSTSKYAWTSGD